MIDFNRDDIINTPEWIKAFNNGFMIYTDFHSDFMIFHLRKKAPKSSDRIETPLSIKIRSIKDFPIELSWHISKINDFIQAQ